MVVQFLGLTAYRPLTSKHVWALISVKEGHAVVYGVWCMVYGVWCMVYGVWCMVYGIWCMVYCVWCMVYGEGSVGQSYTHQRRCSEQTR
jgi:hypothetical protein